MVCAWTRTGTLPEARAVARTVTVRRARGPIEIGSGGVIRSRRSPGSRTMRTPSSRTSSVLTIVTWRRPLSAKKFTSPEEMLTAPREPRAWRWRVPMAESHSRGAVRYRVEASWRAASRTSAR